MAALGYGGPQSAVLHGSHDPCTITVAGKRRYQAGEVTPYVFTRYHHHFCVYFSEGCAGSMMWLWVLRTGPMKWPQCKVAAYAYALSNIFILSAISVLVEKPCVQIPELCEVLWGGWPHKRPPCAEATSWAQCAKLRVTVSKHFFTSSRLNSRYSKNSATICKFVIILSTVTAVFIGWVHAY